MNLTAFATCARRKDTRLFFLTKQNGENASGSGGNNNGRKGQRFTGERVRDSQELATIAENKVIDHKTVGKRKKTSTSIHTISNQEVKMLKMVVKRAT